MCIRDRITSAGFDGGSISLGDFTAEDGGALTKASGIMEGHIFGFDANDEAKLLGINPASVRMKRTRIYQEVQLKHDKETFLRDYIIKNLLK